MSSQDLNHQAAVISNSIKDILEFTFNRHMKMQCFEKLQVDNTYDFSQEFKSKLVKAVSQNHFQPFRSHSSSRKCTSQSSFCSATSQQSILNEYRATSTASKNTTSGSSTCSSKTSSSNTQETQPAKINSNLNEGAVQPRIKISNETKCSEHLLSDDQVLDEFLKDIEMLEHL